MQVKDLISNEFYSTICNLGGKAVLLVSNEGGYNHSGFISTEINHYSIRGIWNGENIENNLKPATELEKAWLKECIKQNKFVPLENIKLIQNDWLWTI